MIALYCGANHSTKGELCGECRKLRDYAFARLDRCLFGARKPICAKCPVHCYKPAMKGQIRTVMRYAGPRMLYRHPGSRRDAPARLAPEWERVAGYLTRRWLGCLGG